MITASNIVDILVTYRCFKYYIKHNDMWVAYETLPEEGEDVKKLLGKFELEEEVDEFLEEYRKKLREHIASLLVLADNSAENKLPAPLAKEVRKGRAPKRSQKKVDPPKQETVRDATPPTDSTGLLSGS